MLVGAEREPEFVLWRGSMSPELWAEFGAMAIDLGAERIELDPQPDLPIPEGPVLNQREFIFYAMRNYQSDAPRNIGGRAWMSALRFAQRQSDGDIDPYYELPRLVLGVPIESVPLKQEGESIRRDVEAKSLAQLAARIDELVADAPKDYAKRKIYSALGRGIGRKTVEFWGRIAADTLEC